MSDTHERIVMVVDDDTLNIKFLSAIISIMGRNTSTGINIVSAENGEEALAMAKTMQPDLVLLDVMMPGMNGYEVCQAMKADPLTAGIKIIFATGMDRDEERTRGLNMGAVDYIMKPFDPSEVTQTLIKWLAPDSIGTGNNPEKPISDPENGLPLDLPGIDLEDGLMRVQGNAKLFRELLIDFRSSKANSVADLRDALANGDNNSLAALAHGLKGVAGNIGAKELNRAAAKMEQAVKEGNKDQFDPLCSALISKISNILETLRHLEENPLSRSLSDEKLNQPVDVGKARPVVNELRSLLKNNDMSADELVDPIRSLLSNGKYSGKMQLLEACIGKLDFPGALKMLDAIDNTLDSET